MVVYTDKMLFSPTTARLINNKKSATVVTAVCCLGVYHSCFGAENGGDFSGLWVTPWTA